MDDNVINDILSHVPSLSNTSRENYQAEYDELRDEYQRELKAFEDQPFYYRAYNYQSWDLKERMRQKVEGASRDA